MSKQREARRARRRERRAAAAEEAQLAGIWAELEAAGVTERMERVHEAVRSPLFHGAFNARLQVVEAAGGPITHQDQARDVALLVLRGWQGIAAEDLEAITLKIPSWNPTTKAMTFRVDPSHAAALAAVARYKAKAA